MSIEGDPSGPSGVIGVVLPLRRQPLRRDSVSYLNAQVDCLEMSRSDEGGPLEVFALVYADKKALRGESGLVMYTTRDST